MNNMKQHIFKTMFWLLSWLCAVSLASCSFDDNGIEQDMDSTATLQLSITAREEGDLNTRATSYEVGQNSEYMHNLLVLIIQDNQVVKKFLPVLSNDEAAQQGNLKTWTSGTFKLAPGTYMVYAFANINTYYSELWGSLTGLEENAPIPDGINPDHIVLEGNPASKLDFTDYFIPMSARKEVTVTSKTRNISIGLDRLVSKIRMNISGKPDTEVTALSFGGYADKIGLFPENQVDNISYTCQYVVVDGSANKPTITLNVHGLYQFADFYVNSSPANSGYKVILSTNEKNGTTYTATTMRNELPRNSIFPLSLNLTGYDVTLDLHCWVSPIGHVPVEVELTPDPDYYTCTIPEGAQFEFTVGVGSSESATIENLKSAWTFDEESLSGLVFDHYNNGDTTVKGHVTASARKTFNLSFDVTWTAGGSNFERKYHVVVTTDDISNFPFKSKTRTPDFSLDYLKHEMLNMFINK